MKEMTCTYSGSGAPIVAPFCMMFAFTLAVFADPPSGFNWTQTFDDEFNGMELDTTKWHPHDYHCGTRNDEVQAYMPENVLIENGLCRLKGEKRAVSYAYCGQSGNTKQYASGIIVSHQKFYQKYGYFEARMKLPRGRNMWPAFWMVSGQGWPPEVDILELINGGDGSQYGYAMAWYTSDRYPACNGSGGSNSYWNSFSGSKDLTTQFFNTAMLWTPDSSVFYVDERKVGKTTKDLQWNCPFFLMLNLAMKPGPNDALLPAYVDIDWVRVWQYSGTVDIQPSRIRAAHTTITPSYANGMLRISAPDEASYWYTLTDATGRLLVSHEGKGSWTASAALNKGIYFFSIKQGTTVRRGSLVPNP
jgi:beta-glucanase (GH16 family)